MVEVTYALYQVLFNNTNKKTQKPHLVKLEAETLISPGPKPFPDIHLNPLENSFFLAPSVHLSKLVEPV